MTWPEFTVPVKVCVNIVSNVVVGLLLLLDYIDFTKLIFTCMQPDFLLSVKEVAFTFLSNYSLLLTNNKVNQGYSVSIKKTTPTMSTHAISISHI